VKLVSFLASMFSSSWSVSSIQSVLVTAQSRPRLIELRKKMRAYDFARTARIPECFRATAAVSRELPQPKFSPATTKSPGCTFCLNSGLYSMKQALASSVGSVVILYRPGVIRSVLMLSPNFQFIDVVSALTFWKGLLKQLWLD